ncbi:MAG: hypothetical protein MJA29_00825, partial [Candidatus Omnitrophica bacterium]|nr:hypothetical protein [Candidatus Omnitrophota bacterium]
MAEGGEKIDDLEKEPVPSIRNETSTSILNPVFEDDEDTQYNTDSGNLSTSTSFTTPERAPTIDPELMEKESVYEQIQDSLKKALTGTNWKFTETGLANLAPRIFKFENKLFYKVGKKPIGFTETQKENMDKFVGKTTGKVYYRIRLTKANGQFYAYDSLTKYGTRFADNLRELLNPLEENIPLKPMTDMDKHQPVQTAETSFIENVINQPNSIDAIIDTDDTTLKDLGFSKNALRELRALKQAGDDLAAVKREKDRQIEVLEEKLKNLERDVEKREKLQKEIIETKEKLEVERKKVFELDRE